MRTFKARTTVLSLVMLGGIAAGAAPISAQDFAPPDTTSSVRGSYVAPPTTTTVPSSDVRAPTATTIPSTPPTSEPGLPTPPSLPPEVPKDIKNPCEEDPELCEIPPFPTFPPTPQPAPAPSTTIPPPTITIPESICEKWPELCKPVEEAPARPTLSRDYAANDAAALRDGLRIHRQTRQRARAAGRNVPPPPGLSVTLDHGSLEGTDAGMTCPDAECMFLFHDWCTDLGGQNATDPLDGGGFEMNCDFPDMESAAAALTITADAALADAGTTCQAIACGTFINWCENDMGGEAVSEHVGGGYHEVTCHLADETGAGESE
jgi:hypothetical protein